MVTVLLEYQVDFWAIGALPLGVALDLALGSFPGRPRACQPIVRLVELADRGLRGVLTRRGETPRAELIAGLILDLIVMGLVGSLAWLAVDLLRLAGGPGTLVGRALIIAWGLSSGRLRSETIQVARMADLAEARRAANRLIGLTASRLDLAGIRKACLQRLGERSTRQVIAPLFWLAIGGAAGLWSYQALDTLRTEVVDGRPRSRYFRFATARLDEIACFVPARLTWLLLSLSAALLGQDGGSAFRFGRSQGRLHPDRPDLWGMATLDGSLGLQPGGPMQGAPVETSTVRRAVWIVQAAGLHAAALAIAYRIIVFGG